jgi:hypothetical protein
MDMLLLNRDMGRPLPETSYGGYTTIMDMLFSTTDSSTMGQNMNTNTQDHSLLLDRGESS